MRSRKSVSWRSRRVVHSAPRVSIAAVRIGQRLRDCPNRRRRACVPADWARYRRRSGISTGSSTRPAQARRTSRRRTGIRYRYGTPRAGRTGTVPVPGPGPVREPPGRNRAGSPRSGSASLNRQAFAFITGPRSVDKVSSISSTLRPGRTTRASAVSAASGTGPSISTATRPTWNPDRGAQRSRSHARAGPGAGRRAGRRVTTGRG